MPTCRDIIIRALRKCRVYAAGEVPSDEDMDDGLDELQSLYEGWGSNGLFGMLGDVMVDSDYEAGENERVTVTDTAVITLATTTEEDGAEYPPYDVAFTEVVNVAEQTVTRYLYENGAWVTISDLTLDSEAPLANRGRGGLSACLALAYAEEFGATVGPGVGRQAMAFKSGLAFKYGSDANRTAPEYF